ncbi:MAG TPA: PrsW family glutamic-type intramembrane protease [Sphingomicrobium sp.]|nr:PrsW family glutamic-type intramembrane protease [Sphingomicrobium sp.]
MALAEIIDWSVALLPVLLMLGLFVWLDVFKLMTLWETLGLLLIGAVTALAAYPVSGVFLDTLPLGYSSYSRFVAPWIEEVIKAVAVGALFWFNRVGYKLDAVITGFAIGAGFSVVENMIYLSRFPELAANVWMVRGLGTAVMHGLTTAIVAATAHEYAERETRGAAAEYRFNILWFMPGLLLAILIHTGFNQFPDQPLLAMIIILAGAPFVIMAIFRFGAVEAQRWLAEEKAETRAALEAWESGRFPDDESGRRIAALIGRSDASTAARMREYCQLLTWLLLQAEDTLHHQAEDTEKLHVHGRQAFERLEVLKRELGRANLAALRALLPFSRNDYWEISELKERLGR